MASIAELCRGTSSGSLAAMKPLRIGIVGAGAIVAERHAPGLARLDGVTRKAVRNPEAPRPRPDFEDGVAYMEVVEEVSRWIAA